MEEKLDMEHRLTEVEARSKSNAHRLDDVEKRQDIHFCCWVECCGNGGWS